MNAFALTDAIDMIDQDDPCSLLFLILVLFVVGSLLNGKSQQGTLTAMKFSGIAFIIYFIYSWASDGAFVSSVILSLIFRALRAAGLVYGLSLIGHSIYKFIDSHFVENTRSKLAEAKSAELAAEAAEQQARLDEQRVRADQQRRQEQEAHASKQAAQKRSLALKEQANASFKDNIRFDVLIEYKAMRKEIHDILPEPEFNELIDAALQANNAVEINRRVKQLRKLLATCQEEKNPQTQGLAGIAKEFADRRADIEASPYDMTQKNKLRRWLEVSEEMQVQRFLREQ